MRHIGSLAAGIVLAPIAFLLIGAGEIGLNTSIYPDAAGAPTRPVALAMFAGGGLLVGLLAVTRWSPAGPLAGSAVFGGGFVLARILGTDLTLPSSLQSAMIPTNAADVAGNSGWAVVIAALLGLALIIPGRWKGKDTDDDRVVDPASLSADAERVDSDIYGSQSGGNDYSALNNRQSNPFDDPSAHPQEPRYDQQPAPQQRSPYADDAYGRAADPFEDYDSRYGTRQQQHGNRYR